MKSRQKLRYNVSIFGLAISFIFSLKNELVIICIIRSNTKPSTSLPATTKTTNIKRQRRVGNKSRLGLWLGVGVLSRMSSEVTRKNTIQQRMSCECGGEGKAATDRGAVRATTEGRTRTVRRLVNNNCAVVLLSGIVSVQAGLTLERAFTDFATNSTRQHA